ncbi:MAG: hypothetical protein KJ077_08210 [Anaerolineae bacterium]|nr:hypothetical protein [Anaerolineae bacterium]
MSEEATNETTLKPTPIQEWRQKRQFGEEVICPSGLTLRARRYSLLDLFSNDLVPQEMEHLLLELIQNPSPQAIFANFNKFSPIIDLTLGKAIIDPPLADEPDDTHLALSELTTMDKMSLFSWLNNIEV